jgi:hypothetical protein
MDYPKPIDKRIRPPDRLDADAQGCVLAFDENAGCWDMRHWQNMDWPWLTWWMPCPPRPEEAVR